MLTDLNTDNKVVGTKETIKAIKDNRATHVFVAMDVDQEIKDQILEVIERKDITIEYIDCKLKLGRACGIDVATASAALLK